MLFVISPAKSLDYDSPLAPELLAHAQAPHFAAQAAALIRLLKPMSPAAIGELMHLSPELSSLNAARYKAWSKTASPQNSRPAVLAFDGDVYDGLAARTLPADQLEWLQRHLAILSGLYGVLRPMDALQPYRLEMGTRLANPKGADLYAYWGDTIARRLNALAAENESPVLVNLASQEYFRAVARRVLVPRVVECVFEDWKSGRFKVISFFAKRARGSMVRYAAQHRIATPKGLEGFDLDGYRFAPEASEPDRLVFRRQVSE